MNLFRLTACNFMGHKDYKIGLKFVFSICGINFRIQIIAYSLVSHPVTIHQNIFLKTLRCEFPYRIFHQLLIIYFLMNELLLSKFIQACQAGGRIGTKKNLRLLRKTSCSFIISFVTQARLQKSFWPSFYTSKNQSIANISVICLFP